MARIKNKKEITKLTPQQERFCILYASDREFFGNGVQSYIEAYNVDVNKKGSYNVARVEASRMLAKPNILKRIDELFEAEGLNDAFVDKQLNKLITQDASFDAKVRAIQEYNKLRGRITERHKHAFEGIADETLAERLAEIVAGSIGDSQGTGNEK